LSDKNVDKLADRIAESVLPILLELGYDLVNTEYVKEGANRYLRFFIEHEDPSEPVTTDDCQTVSEKLSDWLDEADPIPQAYFLEVSSPGIERPLKKEKDFIRFKGHMVQVGTFAPLNGEKQHPGLLGLVTEKELTLKQKDRDLLIPRETISGVRLYWNDKEEG